MGLLLTGFTLIDGTGRDPLPNAALYAKEGRLVWLGPQADLPAEARQVPARDASGRTIIPGLIDAHVHVCWNGREDVLQLVKRERDYLVLEGAATLKKILASGTTAVRDIGGQDYIEMSLRWAVEAGHIIGPRMRTSGKIITMTGGHGHFAAREADGVDELRKAAREQIKAGADTVKLMATGGVATKGQDIQASQFTVEEMAAAAQAAHAMGRTVAAHCHGAGGIKNALLAGIDSIEHASFLNEETADLMRERHASVVFTLGVANPQIEGVSPADRAEAERIKTAIDALRPHLQQAAAIARHKELLVGSGSDAGGNALAPHDFSMAQELAELVNYGFTPMQALVIATRNNARILRWDRDLGTLEAGKLADFVVLTADPLADISNVRQIEAVYKGGERIE